MAFLHTLGLGFTHESLCHFKLYRICVSANLGRHMTGFKMQALLLFKIRNPEITATEESSFLTVTERWATSPRAEPRGTHQGESGGRREEGGAKCG